jgi:flavin-dependent dehydrogenase
MSSVQQKPVLTAFKTHLVGAEPDEGVCEIYSYPAGYGGLNSIGDALDLCFIASSEMVRAIGNDPEVLMRKMVMKNPRAAHSLRNAKAVEPWLAVAIDRFGTANPAPVDGLIAIGDAASFIDPFTGSGILMALESARVAAAVVRENLNDPGRLRASYLDAYSSRFSKRLRYSNLLRFASSSTRIGELAVAALRSSRFLRASVAGSTRS